MKKGPRIEDRVLWQSTLTLDTTLVGTPVKVSQFFIVQMDVFQSSYLNPPEQREQPHKLMKSNEYYILVDNTFHERGQMKA